MFDQLNTLNTISIIGLNRNYEFLTMSLKENNFGVFDIGEQCMLKDSLIILFILQTVIEYLDLLSFNVKLTESGLNLPNK